MILVENWPTALVLIVIVTAICITIVSVVSDIVNRNKPIARHCVRCNKEIKEEAVNNFTKHNIPGWEDDH